MLQALRGNKQGWLVFHLRACRQFAQHIILTPGPAHEKSLVHALLEMHTYLELSTSLHLSTDSGDLHAASLCALASLSNLRDAASFGLLFGCASSLYELIPNIRKLADDRIKEVDLGIDLGCRLSFEDLERRLLDWSWDTTPHPGPSTDSQSYILGKAAAGILVQNTLLLFLYSANRTDQTTLRRMATPIVDKALKAMSIVADNSWRNPVYWPSVVIGSYACTERQRSEVLTYIKPGLAITARATEILHWVWNSPEDVYGLDGLAKVIKERNASYCFG